MIADLHVHTTASDGQLAIERVPAAARGAGLEAVAVTDHDRVHPGIDEPVVRRTGVAVIRGIELRVETDRERLDLLGYAVDPTPALRTELDRLQRDRIERAERIVVRVERRLGVELDLEIEAGVGRPHVARAIERSDADYDYQGAFDRLIGNDCPCYVPREVTPVERGADLLRESCALVALAHPFRYRDPAAALELAAELDAIERFYPYGRTVETALIDEFVAAEDLLVTGGSDAHGTELGLAGLDRESYRRVASRLPKTEP